MAEQKQAPEWIFPGAQVVVLTESRRGNSIEVDTVKNVGKMWITLRDDDTRIPIASLCATRPAYDGTSTKLIELYSEEGQRWMWRKRRTIARIAVKDAVSAWTAKPYSADTRAAVRAALDALDVVIEEGS